MPSDGSGKRPLFPRGKRAGRGHFPRAGSGAASHGTPRAMTTVQTEIEAYAFRQLVAHLRARTDVQNIDQMNLAGFCRNCLSKWYLRGARERGLAMSYDDALEVVYGEPYGTRETAPAKPASAPPADSTFAPTRPPPRSPWAHTPFTFPTSTTPAIGRRSTRPRRRPNRWRSSRRTRIFTPSTRNSTIRPRHPPPRRRNPPRPRRRRPRRRRAASPTCAAPRG